MLHLGRRQHGSNAWQCHMWFYPYAVLPALDIHDASQGIGAGAAGGGWAAPSDAASTVSVVGSTDGRRLASLMESPLEQVALQQLVRQPGVCGSPRLCMTSHRC